MRVIRADRSGSIPLSGKVQIFLGLALILVVSIALVRQLKEYTARQVAPKDIQAVLDAQVAAWNKGDLEGFMAGYWKSDDLRFHSGDTITLGWQPTYDRYQKRYKSEGKKMGELTFSELHIEAETPDMAVARGRWKVIIDEKPSQGLFTLIFRKIDDKWVIVYDHTSATTP